jgi:cation diffusion facilitator CzcD-associated flavoprotein CzcO
LADPQAPREFDAVVVGAGFAGMYTLHRLRTMGLSVAVIEAASGVGGTWYWNRYPGARCDSESFAYSYSFSEELQQEWEWTERYPEQAEILRYLNHVADRFDLRRDITFDTRVTQAVFHPASTRWEVATDTGGTFLARYLITAVGCLSTASTPDIAGLADFDGEWYHTGQWPHDGVDFTGKRVGVVGTGSTGIQAIPVIAAEAEHVTVFQRTANYSIPSRNRPLGSDEAAEIKRNYDDIRATQRSTTNGHPYRISERTVRSVTDEERQAIYEAGWELGGLRLRATFQDILTDEDANDTLSDFIRDKIRTVVKDPETAEKLVPYDHPFATKRPPIDTNYFETYNRPNVDLVDVRESPIEAIEPDGLRTTAAHYDLDVLVFATGFDALTGPLLALDIRTDDGNSLRDKWADGPRTYLGLQTAGFPNLFTITGPGSPSVLTNMPTAIEQHVDWICDCIEYMRANGLTQMQASEAAEAGWAEQVQAAAERTLLPKAASSWYLGANIPGKPRVFLPYAGGLAEYARRCDEVARAGYQGFVLS